MAGDNVPQPGPALDRLVRHHPSAQAVTALAAGAASEMGRSLVRDPSDRDSPPIGGSRTEEERSRFEALIADQIDSLYRSALRLTRNRSAAEDLVQDVMLNAWRSFHTFQAGTSIRAWLHRILINAHFSHYRKQTREPEVTNHEAVGEFYLYERAGESATLGDAGNPEIEVLGRVMDSEVRDALDSLPLPFRSAVILADVQGFSYKEIGYILKIPIGTVMSRLFRGRHMLQRKLWDYARDHNYVP